ncbi:transporter substrate-binding domain-containing protein [Inquilinus sp. Marseille-Q2685]|uniref:transporter substrate-binding domain-containing protein n=1 Tax=Inquilinus sp. Marseille-Q2685 TaxID=2866581 RepID=UPI0035AB87A1
MGGTTSARYLGAANIQPVTFANAEDAYRALIDDRVDAVVYDAPVLQYIAAHEGLGRAGLVGPIFQPEDYGFVFRNDSDLRRDVDAALLSMRQDGSYEELRERWFGKS